MNIDEAIKTLKILESGDTADIADTWLIAVRLGIEALQRFKEAAAWDGRDLGRPLPSETE